MSKGKSGQRFVGLLILAEVVFLAGALLIAGRIFLAYRNRAPTELQPSRATSTVAASRETPAGQPVATISPTPMIYTVVAGDTLWDIALRFETTLAAILAANPALDPDIPLQPGDHLLIQPGGAAAPLEGTSSRPVTAQIPADGGGVNLRRSPSVQAEILLTLNALAPLTVVGRTYNDRWLEVITASGNRGWVYGAWVETFIDLEQVPIVYVLIATPSAPSSTQPVASTPSTPPPFGAYPFLYGITERAHEVFRQGQLLGNRADVFSKIGDSITVTSAFLDAVGTANTNLDFYSYLQPVIDFYTVTWARTHYSFANTSLAARGGWLAAQALEPGLGNPIYCSSLESPLECEYRWVRPSVALIMLGTNDVLSSTSTEGFAASMREIVEISILRGVIPVVSTIPPIEREGASAWVDAFNAQIVNLAQEYQVPLWDYRAALNGLPNGGLSSDGVHPSWAAAGHTADFSPPYLTYGMNMRALTALQALDAIWRSVIQPELVSPTPPGPA